MSFRKLSLLVFSSLINCFFSAHVVLVDRFTFIVDDHDLFLSQSAVVEQESNRSYLSGHIVINRLVNDLTLVSSMDIMRPPRPDMRLYTVKLNFCSILNNAYKNRFIRMLYNNYAEFLNTKPKCPLKPVSLNEFKFYTHFFNFKESWSCFKIIAYFLELL